MKPTGRMALLIVTAMTWISCASSGVPAPETPTPAAEPAAAPAAEAPAASTAEGRSAFLDICSGCHGQEAEGGLGPPLAGTQRDAGTLSEVVRNGLGNMPPLDPGLISDEEIEQVAAFLNSLGG